VTDVVSEFTVAYVCVSQDAPFDLRPAAAAALRLRYSTDADSMARAVAPTAKGLHDRRLIPEDFCNRTM